MSTIIKLKRSTSASSTPSVSDLVDGEIAVNVVDKKIFVRNGGSVVEVANNVVNSGSTDLSSVGTSIIPDTDNTFDIGISTAAFRDVYVDRDIRTGNFIYGTGRVKCNVFTNSGGLTSSATEFSFRPATSNAVFDEVFTVSSGLASKSISLSTIFNDSNPAFTF